MPEESTEIPDIGPAATASGPDGYRRLVEVIKSALRAHGLLFVGIDVIDGNLTEINVTSPTGIRAVANLGGPDIAALIWDRIEARRA